MSPKILITGATGYIGGDALAVIIDKHPDWQVTCLVRNSDKGSKIAAKYVAVTLVYGDLDSIDLIEEEASKADVVFHFADCDHEPSAEAIAKGLARRSSPDPGFWIHTSGTMILAYECLQKQLFGEPTSKIFNDWDGIQELTSIPDESPHRNVDKIVLNTSVLHPNVKTAIVCPPTVYGTGRGPDNQKSKQAYRAAEIFLKLQQGFQIGKGQNIWHQVHVFDLSQLYLLLAEAAAAGGLPATWDDQGYYLVENGEFMWGDVLSEIARVAHKKGLIPTSEIKIFSPEEAAEIAKPHRAHIGIGSTSRGISLRARNLLGWKPREKLLIDEVPEIVDIEAKQLGLIRGHGEKVEEQSN